MKRLSFFLRIHIRNLFTNKKFAWVNIIGLSAGVTVSILILLYIRYETSFESFNPNSGNIYRIVTKNIQDGSIGASTPLALSDVLKSDYPEIDKVTGLMRVWDDIKIDNKRFGNLKGAIVESDFFDLFNLPMLTGNRKTIFIHKWLDKFAYKTDLSLWVFVMVGLIAMGVGMITVSWQSRRVSTRNPVEALRYE